MPSNEKETKPINKILLIVMVIVLLVSIAALVKLHLEDRKAPETLGDIAYDVKERYGYTIYLEEADGYEPYLVLTNNYENTGNVLVLREKVLDEWQPYNDPERETSYYENSYIDEYLNTVFLNTLPESLQDKILDTDIQILNGPSYSAIKDGATTNIINRKLFLLSYAEVSKNPVNRDVLDGEFLKYFRERRSKLVAVNSSGEPDGWMLRSPSLVYITTSMAVTYEGQIGLAGEVEGPKGVRPAFCLSSDLKIEKSGKIKAGEEVYIIQQEEKQ